MSEKQRSIYKSNNDPKEFFKKRPKNSKTRNTAGSLNNSLPYMPKPNYVDYSQAEVSSNQNSIIDLPKYQSFEDYNTISIRKKGNKKFGSYFLDHTSNKTSLEASTKLKGLRGLDYKISANNLNTSIPGKFMSQINDVKKKFRNFKICKKL